MIRQAATLQQALLISPKEASVLKALAVAGHKTINKMISEHLRMSGKSQIRKTVEISTRCLSNLQQLVGSKDCQDQQFFSPYTGQEDITGVFKYGPRVGFFPSSIMFILEQTASMHGL